MALDTASAVDAPPSEPDASAAVRPLLSDAAETAAGESAEELDARYAPYARRDAYGTMGRDLLAPAEAVLLALAAAVLVPLRFVAGMLVLLLSYLVCRVCTMYADADEGRPWLAGWRKKAVLWSGCALSRDASVATSMVLLGMSILIYKVSIQSWIPRAISSPFLL